MKIQIRQLMFCAVLVVAPSAWAEAPDVSECEFPDSPEMVDGASISQEQMVAMGTAVRGYVDAMQSALGCIDAVEAKLGEAITPEQKGSLNALYNDGVEQMQALAEAYNEQARAFKARE